MLHFRIEFKRTDSLFASFGYDRYHRGVAVIVYRFRRTANGNR